MKQYTAHEAAVKLASQLNSINEWEELKITLNHALQEVEDLSTETKPGRVYTVAPATQSRVDKGRHSLLARLRFNLAIVGVFLLDVLRNPTTSSRISADIDTGVIKVEPI